MNIYRSTGDGTNELFLSAADLGLSTVFCCGNVDGIFYDEDAGTLLFSVAFGTQGEAGTAVEDAQNLSTLDSLVFSTPGDGSNPRALPAIRLG